MRSLKLSITCLLLISLIACQSNKVTQPVEQKVQKTEINFDIPYEQFTLDNGLNVILHKDDSDPIVAIATIIHAGSNREKAGRTGFAHFFEHMSFNNSENVPMGANRKMIPELGGTRNGGTWTDGTQYYEVVPKDAFEKLMWIDSDRFGYMINTVTQGTLEREKQVVKNEKRQRVDNRAYGHSDHVIRKALYPKSHPYNWTVIGDLEDLQNATLDDVREFYDKYYIPANATLVIAGDIDLQKTKTSVQNWFGEIAKKPTIDDLKPMPVTLTESKKLYHLDNFAKLPEIRLTYPTVEQYSKDSYALNVLAYVLSGGKKSPLYTTIVEDKKLAPSVSSYSFTDELAGTFLIRVRANAGVDLDDVYAAINESFKKFEKNGIRDNDLIKIKAYQETSFYSEISSVLNKAFQLAIYNEYAGDPAFIKQDIQNIMSVTKADVIRVYEKYIKNKPAIITSFVPKDNPKLMVINSEKAYIVEEKIVQGKEKTFKEELNPKFTITPTKFDRSEPPLSELPSKALPKIWRDKLTNGINIIGIEQHELPLIHFSLRIAGGQLLDEADKLGTANLLASMLNEGTAFKTPTELEDAIGLLGSSIDVYSSPSSLSIVGTTLARNYQKTMDLVTEILLHPRFDDNDFKRLKAKQLTSIKSSFANPNTVARQIFKQELYGKSHILGQVLGGYADTVKNITFADIKNYYHDKLSLKNTSFRVVGDFDSTQVKKSLQTINTQFNSTEVTLPTYDLVDASNKPKLYFIDFPDAKQSAIYFGKTLFNAKHPDNNKLEIVNNRLGAGSSARLTQILRIQKGYTYGAYSFIQKNNIQNTFTGATQVRSNVTKESLAIIQDQLNNYSQTFSPQELEVTKNLILKGNSRKYETLRQLLGIVQDIDYYGNDDDYLTRNQEELKNMDIEQAHQVIRDYLDPQQMIYVIVGDAKTQLPRLSEQGYGEVIQLDVNGNEL